jgi:hypothetical protein
MTRTLLSLLVLSSLFSWVNAYAPYISYERLQNCAFLKPLTYLGSECVNKLNSTNTDIVEFCQLPSSTCKSKFISYLRVLSAAGCTNYNCSSLYYELVYNYAYDKKATKFCSEFSDSEVAQSRAYLRGDSKELNCSGITYCSLYWAGQQYGLNGGSNFYQFTSQFITKLGNCSAKFTDISVCDTALIDTPKFSGSNSLCGTFTRKKSAQFNSIDLKYILTAILLVLLTLIKAYP